MVYLGAFSLTISIIGLYIMLFSSFSPGEQRVKGDFIVRAARKIRIRKENAHQNAQKENKPNPQFIMLLESIVVGHIVGLFFLIISSDDLKFKILAYDAGFLLIASFLCSVLTLLNTWLKKKTNLPFRITLQAATLIIGLILMRFAVAGEAGVTAISSLKAASYMVMAIYSYYITVVIAIFTMLYAALKGIPDNYEAMEFSSYLMLVIISGLLIGSGLLLIYTLKWVRV